MSSIRQLAAIMFTDMAIYNALIGDDEQIIYCRFKKINTNYQNIITIEAGRRNGKSCIRG